MNHEIAQWLDSWGEWLDAILVSGVSSPGTATRAMIENWRLSAQMLGFARQSDMAGDLLNGNSSNKQRARALEIVAGENINHMTDDEIAKHPHISSRQTTKWAKYFKDVHREAFKERFGDALVLLGYEDF